MPHNFQILWKSSSIYFTLLDILKLKNIFKLKIGSLVHKLQYNKQETLPTLHDLVSLASAVHKHNTRIATGQNFCLRSKRSRTSRTKYRDARRSFRIRDSRKMGREQKVRERRVGEGKEGNACSQTPLFWKTRSVYHLSGIFGSFFWTNGTAPFFH